MRFFLSVLLLVSSSAFAHLLQDEITGEKSLKMTLKEACELMGHKELLLVEVRGGKIDCMGRDVDPQAACLKKRDEGFLKSVLREDKLICFYGKQVILGLSCDERDAHYCEDSKKSCLALGQKFALRLELMNHALVYRGKEKGLTCLFDSPSNNQP